MLIRSLTDKNYSNVSYSTVLYIVSVPLWTRSVIFFRVNVHSVSVVLSRLGLVHCNGSDQGFWSFWSHFNMTFIPRPWRVVSKAWTACSRGNRWVTRGFTFTLPDASMAMAIGQLQNSKTNILIDVFIFLCLQDKSQIDLYPIKNLHTEQEWKLKDFFLRVAVAENPSDVHLSHSSIDERKTDHLRAETHQHHYASWTCRLIGEITWIISSADTKTLCWKTSSMTVILL